METHEYFPETREDDAPASTLAGRTPIRTPLFRGSAGTDTEQLAFILLPHFSMIAFTAAMEPLRLANMLWNRDLFSWTTHTMDGQPVEASSGLRILPDGDLDAASLAPNAMICAGMDGHKPADRRLVRWLRKIDRAGAHIGAVCTGAFALADAGLLDDHACTVHWSNHDAFRERYPRLNLSTDLFAIGRRRFTCAGGTGVLDMILHHISARCGEALSRQIASRLFHSSIRDAHAIDAAPLRIQLGTTSEMILTAVEIMAENIETPVSIDDIAAQSGRTPRQLQRLFADTFGATPSAYYRQLRLTRARRLLQQTDLPVTEVGMACGFISLSHFSSCYRKLFGHTPRAERLRLKPRYA